MLRKAISLFAGAGGCSLGFEWAGFDLLLGIDNNEDAVQTYRENFSSTPCLLKDITELTADDILDISNLKRGELDFLIGGPSCQGFSSAGVRFWDDPRNRLLKHYVRLLRGLRPHWFLMENVEGLLTADKSKYIFEVTKSFIEAGYTVRLHKLYAHWYGLPQMRKRVFIIGNSHGIEFEFPDPTHTNGTSQAGLFGLKPPLTIIDATSDLPGPAGDEEAILHYITTPQNEYQCRMQGRFVTDHWVTDLNGDALERVELLAPGQTMKDLPKHLQHPSFQRRAFRRVMDGTPTEKRGGPPSGLKRLKPNEPSLTITSAAIREFVHPTEDRFLTIRECARIQSFPDDFQFYGSTNSKITLIGNAIPPLVAQILATHIRQCNDGEDGEQHDERVGKLLGYYLTKADSMSPALTRTDRLLSSLCNGNFRESIHRK